MSSSSPSPSQLDSPVLAACYHLIRPLAKLLLRYGIGYREFSEVCKAVFVEVAADQFGIRGRPANMSRIAVLTGLSRKEVRKNRDKERLPSRFGSNQGLSPASMVLRAWYSNPEFVGEDGVPIALPIDGGPRSVTKLVAQLAGDIPPGAVIGELRRNNLVQEDPAGKLRPAGPYFIPANVDGQLFAHGATSIHNLISTVAHNADPENDNRRYFERYAWSTHLPKQLVQRFHQSVTESGSEFLEKLDRWLRQHETTVPDADVGPEVGVGVYFFTRRQSRSTRRKDPELGSEM